MSTTYLMALILMITNIERVIGTCSTDGSRTYFCDNLNELTSITYPWGVDIIKISTISKLQTLQRNIFSKFNNLYELHIENTTLFQLTPLFFFGLKNLHKLNLKRNEINTIKYGVFNSLLKLNVIDLSYNSIDTIDENSFQGIEIIENIDLSNNKLSHLKNFTFNGTQIQTINLQNNSIEKIDSKAFYGLKSLRTLYLNHNKLKYFTKGCFFNLTYLMLLDLSNNCITQLSYGLIDGLPSLDTLDISYNYLTKLSGLLHTGITSLKISFNKIENLESSALFEKVPALRFISVEGNVWNCEYLHNFIITLHKHNILVEVGKSVYEMNIQGIGCNENITKLINKQLDDDQKIFLYSMDIKNTSFYDYFNRDFFLSTIYKGLESLKLSQDIQNNVTMDQNNEIIGIRRLFEKALDIVVSSGNSSSVYAELTRDTREAKSTTILLIFSFLVLFAIFGVLIFDKFIGRNKYSTRVDEVQMI